jgi:hypothetical protein
MLVLARNVTVLSKCQVQQGVQYFLTNIGQQGIGLMSVTATHVETGSNTSTVTLRVVGKQGKAISVTGREDP